MLDRLNISAKLLVLVAVLLLATLAVGGYGIATLATEQQRASENMAHMADIQDAAVAARAAEVAFKVQVQEWKNILLRGHDQADHDKYLASFREHAKSVGTQLDGVEQ